MPKINKTIKNIVEVTFSNITTIISGVVIGLLLPKILPLEDYGWYKTFTLYTTYVGFCSLGIIDGIVLEHGGDDYKDLNKPLFRSYFKHYILVNCIFAILLFMIAPLLGDDYSFIAVMLGLYIVAANISGYFQQLSQITQRFREYSIRKVIFSALKIVVVVFLFLCSYIGIDPRYKLYLTMFIAVEYILTVWYLVTYKDLIFGFSEPLKKTSKDIIHLSKIGFPLLFANLCSTLILSLDRQFVSLLFDTQIYAKYAFAYNMLSLVTVAMSAISTVLYPTLKRTTAQTMKNNYESLVGIISVLVFATIAAYYPLCLFVEWFLPKYIESLPIFRIVFPGLALSSSITVIMHNYYKTLKKNILYFKKSIVVLVVSGIANVIAYLFFHTPTAISIASIITMIFWYLYIDHYFVVEYGYSRNRNLIYLFLMMIVFYASSLIENHWIALLLYMALYIVITILIHKKTVKVDLVNIIKKK